MLNERKRFSYLTVQQRTLNSSNVIDSEKAAISSKPGSILSSNTKSHKRQQPPLSQGYKSLSRNSSIKKTVEPLSEIQQTTKNIIVSDKENSLFKHSMKKDEKSFQNSFRPSTQLQLQARVKQLEESNQLILKQTEQKFLQMEKHLEKVEGILKEKQVTIQTLSKEKNQMNQRCKSLQSEVQQLKDQKDELLRILADKNEEMKKFMIQKQKHVENQAELLNQINTYTLNSKLSSIESLQPKTLNVIQTVTFSSQTQLKGSQIDQIFTKNSQPQDKMNYRQKYQVLFKKALEMEDEMYKLKEELFDSQNEVKTIQQEFNTYKIFNQIEKINQKI